MTETADYLKGVDPDLHVVLGRYMLLEERKSLLRDASENTAVLYTDLIAGDQRLLDEGLSQPPVAEALDTYLDEHFALTAKRDVLNAGNGHASVELAKVKASLDEAQKHPLHRLAMLYQASKLAVGGAISETATPPPPTVLSKPSQESASIEDGKEEKLSYSVEEFFTQDVQTVANALIGMKIQVGDKFVIIKETRAQDGNTEFNKKNSKRPIFGENRYHFYFPRVYTTYFPFAQAGKPEDLACVGLMAGVSDEGKELTRPSHIAKALDVTKASVAKASFEGQTLVLEIIPISS